MALLVVLLLVVLIASATALIRLAASDRSRQTMEHAASARAAISRASEASVRHGVEPPADRRSA